jgi:hypothetical protein
VLRDGRNLLGGGGIVGVLVPESVHPQRGVYIESVSLDGHVLHGGGRVRGVLPGLVRDGELLDGGAHVRAAESVRAQRCVLLADGDVQRGVAGGVRGRGELDAGRYVRAERVRDSAAGGVLQSGAGNVREQLPGAVCGAERVDERRGVQRGGVSAAGGRELLHAAWGVFDDDPGELPEPEHLDERGGVQSESVLCAADGELLHNAHGRVCDQCPVPVHGERNGVDGWEYDVQPESVPAAADGHLLQRAHGRVHVWDSEQLRVGDGVEPGWKLHACEHLRAAAAGNLLQSDDGRVHDDWTGDLRRAGQLGRGRGMPAQSMHPAGERGVLQSEHRRVHVRALLRVQRDRDVAGDGGVRQQRVRGLADGRVLRGRRNLHDGARVFVSRLVPGRGDDLHPQQLSAAAGGVLHARRGVHGLGPHGVLDAEHLPRK